MNKELNLQIPDSLFSNLLLEAKEQGVSIEALCLSLLGATEGGKSYLVEPSLYSSLANGEIRNEMKKVLQSELSKDEMKKRVRNLETQIIRCIR